MTAIGELSSSFGAIMKKLTRVDVTQAAVLPVRFRNQIICGDILDCMKEIPSESIDLVITSPPYNLKNSTGNGMKDGRGGKWSKASWAPLINRSRIQP
jgi:hypothetical protein